MTLDAIPVPAIVTDLQELFSELAAANPSSASPSSASGATGPGAGTSAPSDPFSVLLAAASAPSSSTTQSPASGSGSTGSSPAALADPATSSGLSPNLVGGAASSSAGGASSDGGQAVVADAERYLGVPYVWGGTSPTTGFDCSGLVQHVYADLGISLPRTAAEQATTGTPVASLADAQPGDLLFFNPGEGGIPANEPGHVGIYVGNGEMIDAPYTGTDVQVQAVTGAPFEIRRESLPASAASTSPSPTSEGTTAIGSVQVPSADASLVQQASSSSGVPASLLAALLQTESGFDPTAVSSAGAEGIAQLLPSTAAAAGVNPNDPAQAIPAAASILAGNERQLGSWDLALAAYNAGMGAVEQAGGIPQNGTTPSYVQTILSEAGLTSSASPNLQALPANSAAAGPSVASATIASATDLGGTSTTGATATPPSTGGVS
ncbi:MAG: Lytic murein transglycosylase [Acidimicrobiaceae bacterium]|nr:Lytic murein transglycosylase [Acidimicrobiaceae bacterium]